MSNVMSVVSGEPRVKHTEGFVVVEVDVLYSGKIIDTITSQANFMSNAAVGCIEYMVDKYGACSTSRYQTLLRLMN